MSSTRFENWFKRKWEILSALAAALTGALAYFFGEGLASVLGFALAVFVAFFGPALHRRITAAQRRHRHTRTGIRLAFRGWGIPFEQGDVLPCERRRFEARQLLALLNDRETTTTILDGDIGAGKTSLIRSMLIPEMIAQGTIIDYIPRLADTDKSTAAEFAKQRRRDKTFSRARLDVLAHRVSEMVAAVEPTTDNRPVPSEAPSENPPLNQLDRTQRDETSAAPNVKGLLILDHFDEWIADYDDPNTLVEWIRKVFLDQDLVTLLIVLRSVDSAGILASAISARHFHLRAITPEEAESVIEECCKRDSCAFSRTLATYVTRDLAFDNQVRFPDLQLVCSELAPKLNYSRREYLDFGGAHGILVDFVRKWLQCSIDASLRTEILRALSDVGRNGYITVEQILATLHSDQKTSDAPNRIERQLSELTRMGLLRSRPRTDGINGCVIIAPPWQSAIAAATAPIEAGRAAAIATLEYHRREYCRLPQVVIPSADLTQILSHVPPHSDEYRAARGLIRRSVWKHRQLPRLISVGVAIVVLVLVVLLGPRRTWTRRILMDQDTSINDSSLQRRGKVAGHMSAYGTATWDETRVFTTTYATATQPQIRIMSATTAQVEAQFSGHSPILSPTRRYIAARGPRDDRIIVCDRDQLNQFEIVVHNGLSKPSPWFFQFVDQSTLSIVLAPCSGEVSYRFYSLDTQRLLGSISGDFFPEFSVTTTADPVYAMVQAAETKNMSPIPEVQPGVGIQMDMFGEEDRATVEVWDVAKKRRLFDAGKSYPASDECAAAIGMDGSGAYAIIVRRDKSSLRLKRWSIPNGSLTHDVSAEVDDIEGALFLQLAIGSRVGVMRQTQEDAQMYKKPRIVALIDPESMDLKVFRNHQFAFLMPTSIDGTRVAVTWYQTSREFHVLDPEGNGESTVVLPGDDYSVEFLSSARGVIVAVDPSLQSIVVIEMNSGHIRHRVRFSETISNIIPSLDDKTIGVCRNGAKMCLIDLASGAIIDDLPSGGGLFQYDSRLNRVILWEFSGLPVSLQRSIEVAGSQWCEEPVWLTKAVRWFVSR